MNFLSIILMAVMALGLIHCGEDTVAPDGKEPGVTTIGDPNGTETLTADTQPFRLKNKADDDADVFFSFNNGSTDREKSFLLAPFVCLTFSGVDLAGLTVWTAGEGLLYRPKVLCGNGEEGEEVVPCEGGNYEITDNAWALWDNYTMELTEELDEASCLEVTSQSVVTPQTTESEEADAEGSAEEVV